MKLTFHFIFSLQIQKWKPLETNHIFYKHVIIKKHEKYVSHGDNNATILHSVI
jgi:hypothetical protein